MSVIIIILIAVLIVMIAVKISNNNKEKGETYNRTYGDNESYNDAHELAEKAGGSQGLIFGSNTKPSSSAKTTEKKSVAKKDEDHSADKITVEKAEINKESWQPYIAMLHERYPNMSQYLVLKSWEHPIRPGEYDGGLALIRCGEIWYFCEDVFFYTLGEEIRKGYHVGKDEFQHNCYCLPDDFFDNTTWENLEGKLRAVNWQAGSAKSS